MRPTVVDMTKEATTQASYHNLLVAELGRFIRDNDAIHRCLESCKRDEPYDESMSRQYDILVDMGILAWRGNFTKLGYNVLAKIEENEWEDTE